MNYICYSKSPLSETQTRLGEPVKIRGRSDDGVPILAKLKDADDSLRVYRAPRESLGKNLETFEKVIAVIHGRKAIARWKRWRQWWESSMVTIQGWDWSAILDAYKAFDIADRDQSITPMSWEIRGLGADHVEHIVSFPIEQSSRLVVDGTNFYVQRVRSFSSLSPQDVMVLALLGQDLDLRNTPDGIVVDAVAHGIVSLQSSLEEISELFASSGLALDVDALRNEIDQTWVTARAIGRTARGEAFLFLNGENPWLYDEDPHQEVPVNRVVTKLVEDVYHHQTTQSIWL